MRRNDAHCQCLCAVHLSKCETDLVLFPGLPLPQRFVACFHRLQCELGTLVWHVVIVKENPLCKCHVHEDGEVTVKYP